MFYSMCLAELVSIKNPCDDSNSTLSTTYDVTDIPGFSWSSISKITNERYTKIQPFLERLLYKAKNEMLNDFMGVFASNGVGLVGDSGLQNTFDNSKNVYLPLSFSSTYVGIVLTQRDIKKYKKVRINKICVKGNTTINTTIRIEFNGLLYNLPISLVAGQKSCITRDMINNMIGSDLMCLGSIKILIDSSLVSLESQSYHCPGCIHNGCVNVVGFNGVTTVNGEAYGISAELSCGCDFEEIFCHLSLSFKSLLSSLLLKKLELLILEERLNTDRLNSYVIFGKEQAVQERNRVIQEYNTMIINTYTAMSFSIANTNFDGCIDCRGIKLKLNY